MRGTNSRMLLPTSFDQADVASVVLPGFCYPSYPDPALVFDGRRTNMDYMAEFFGGHWTKDLGVELSNCFGQLLSFLNRRDFCIYMSWHRWVCNGRTCQGRTRRD